MSVSDMAFRPAKVVPDKYNMKASYVHLPTEVHVKKNYRDPEDNHVIIGPRNFTTMPSKKGEVGKGTSFGGQIPHLPDGYE